MLRIAAKRQFDNRLTTRRVSEVPTAIPWTDLDVPPTALTQPNRIETDFRHGYQP